MGSYEANKFELHDMVGNIREWCKDIYTSERGRLSLPLS
ncbi:MAG: formylglycine-generating enzyme family protein [Desulfobacterales bacterium]|nr:formylglycine-generating enzyme family protein [Desulfobacterales bacterium]